MILGSFETHFLRDKVIAALPLQPYPVTDLSSSRLAVSQALAKVDEQTKRQAYQAWLGYYKSNLRALKWTPEVLIQQANDYAKTALLYGADKPAGQWRPPPMKAQTIGKMGLKAQRSMLTVEVEQPGQGGGRGGQPAKRPRGEPNAGPGSSAASSVSGMPRPPPKQGRR